MHAESDRGLRVLGHCFDETACTGCLVPGMLSANSFHTASAESRLRNILIDIHPLITNPIGLRDLDLGN